MLIINDIKDSYGCFSKAGRKSIEENILLLRHRKQKLSRKKSSSASYSNLFNSSRDKIKLEIKSKDNDFDIFTIEEPDKEKLDDIAKEIIKKSIQKIEKRNSEKLNNNSNNKKEKEKNKKENEKEKEKINNNSLNLKLQVKYFFHCKNHKKIIKKKKFMVPPCTKYYPKYYAILRRSASTPLWKSLTGRKDTKKDKYDFPFYMKHELIQDNMAGKIFIDFSKQTIRKCFLENNKENNSNDINISKKRALSCRNKSANLINKISFKNKNNKENKNNISNHLSNTNTSNDSYDIYKNFYTKKLLKRKMENKAKKEKEMEESKKK